MSTWFSIKEGVAGFKRAPLASIVTITSVALALLLLGYFILFSVNINRWIGEKRSKMEMEVFLDDDLDGNSGLRVANEIKKLNGVTAVVFISKADAARRFEKEFGRNIFDILNSNPLPPSCTVKVEPAFQTSSSIQKIELLISKIEGVNDIIYQKELLQLIDKYISIIYLVLGVFGLVLLIIAIILLYNTIRLTIYARRDNIEIMNLVGATKSFIRRPFIIEGFLQGLIGSLLASGLLYGTVLMIQRLFYPALAMHNYIYISLVLSGVLIGMLSSLFSLSKHLDRV